MIENKINFTIICFVPLNFSNILYFTLAPVLVCCYGPYMWPYLYEVLVITDYYILFKEKFHFPSVL